MRVVSTVSVKDIDWAKDRRARAHKTCGSFDRFPELKSDQRWVGDLAELVIHRELGEWGIDHEWNAPESENQDVFVPPKHRISVKSRKCARRPATYYEVHCLEKHAMSTDYDWLVFLVYVHKKMEMHIMGAVCRFRFLAESHRKSKTSGADTNAYTARATNRHIQCHSLLPPADWLCYLRMDQSAHNL